MIHLQNHRNHLVGRRWSWHGRLLDSRRGVDVEIAVRPVRNEGWRAVQEGLDEEVRRSWTAVDWKIHEVTGLDASQMPLLDYPTKNAGSPGWT